MTEHPAPDPTRQLDDGRIQQWNELGPVDGRPVLFCHGGNDCRLESLWIAEAVERAGVRMITPDRPGFGGSTLSQDRSFRRWVADAVGLLDHLGLDRVDLLGLSGGGPHALAVAALAPERVGRVDIVASPCPWDTPGFLAGTWLPIRMIYLLARYAPDGLFRQVQRAMNDPRRNLQYADRMPAPDARMLRERPEVGQAMVRSVEAAHAHGFDGAVQEWRCYTRDWGFALDQVQAPVRLWYGDQDGMAPARMGRVLQSRLRNATLQVVDNRAHLSIFVEEASVFLAA